MVRASGYLKTLDDFRAIPLAARGGVPVTLGDVATRAGRPRDAPRHRRARRRGRGGRRRGDPALGQERAGDDRRGQGAAGRAAAEPAAGRGDRHHLRPQRADRARDRTTCRTSCSRSSSSSRWCARCSCGTCARRWWRSSRCRWACWRAFLVMRWQGINANIMSLGGIAIAIGAMVDAAVVMIENAHKKIEAWQHAHPGQAARRRGALAGHHATPRSRSARRCSSRC